MESDRNEPGFQAEEQNNFQDVLDYLSKHAGDISGNCCKIAIEIGALLAAHRQKPHIIVITAKDKSAFAPKEFPEANWGEHYVTVSQDVVYDPVVGEPLPLKEYLERTFTKEVEWHRDYYQVLREIKY